jgi:hypothetical protein
LPAIPAGYGVTAFTPAHGTVATPAVYVVGTSGGGTSELWHLELAADGSATNSQPLRTFWGSAAVAAAGDRVLVGTANGALVSTDRGQTWQESRLGLENVTLSVDPTRGPIPDEEMQRGFGLTAAAIEATGEQRLFLGTVDGVHVSADGGASWARLPETSGLINALLLTPRGSLLVETPSGVVTIPVAVEGAAGPAQATPVGATPVGATPVSG